MSYIKQESSGGGGDTYTLKAAQSGADVDIQLDAAAGSDSDVKLKAGTNITLTEASDTITIDATGSIGGTIADQQVAFGSAANTISGSANLLYDSSNKKLTVKTDGVADTVVLESTDAGSASHAPDLKLYRNSASPATNDKLGEIRFAGNKSDGSEYSVTKITAEMNTLDNSDRLSIDVASSGGGGQQNYEYMRFDGGIRDVVFNETGVDIDFRIEGENDQDLFVTDASADVIGVGIGLGSLSSAKFQVGGLIESTTNGYRFPDGTVQTSAAQISHTPQLAVDLFGAASSLVTVYPLLASGQSAQDTTSDLWNDSVSTTTLFLWPCIAPKTGTINGLQLRTGATAGDDLHIGLYKSDATTGLPNGAAAFSTSITPATNTSYTPTISVSSVTKGDILYFATFGQSTRTNLRVIDVSDGGTFAVGRGVSSVNYSSGGSYQNVQLSGQTNGVFPTLSSITTQYTGNGEPDFVPRIGITYS